MGDFEEVDEAVSQQVARLLPSPMPVAVILSFEGPDAYARAGGLGSRVTALSESLVEMGIETHLFFVGDPDLPGHEVSANGLLHLHRWCQWISRYYPGGVYHGQEDKLRDWDTSLSPWIASEVLRPALEAGKRVVVLGEEWQTARSITQIYESNLKRGWEESVKLMWNANNVFGFHRIPWLALKNAATLTTVSRFMKHTMWRWGVDPVVIPNGISQFWLTQPDVKTLALLRRALQDRITLVKIGRWDPDKRWLTSVEAVAELKRLGQRPLFIVRGGVEEHGLEVLARMAALNLTTATVRCADDVQSLSAAVLSGAHADVVLLDSPLSQRQLKVLYRAANAVLANSGVEPFGLVGLEAMACGGVVYVGATGEDYAASGSGAISLQTDDYREIVAQVAFLRQQPDRAIRQRRAARAMAANYLWPDVIQGHLLPLLRPASGPFTADLVSSSVRARPLSRKRRPRLIETPAVA